MTCGGPNVLFYTLQTTVDMDFLTIYDGDNAESNEIRKLSGASKSFGVSSSGNVMYLTFKMLGNYRENGFLAKIYHGNNNIIVIVNC